MPPSSRRRERRGRGLGAGIAAVSLRGRRRDGQEARLVRQEGGGHRLDEGTELASRGRARPEGAANGEHPDVGRVEQERAPAGVRRRDSGGAKQRGQIRHPRGRDALQRRPDHGMVGGRLECGQQRLVGGQRVLAPRFQARPRDGDAVQPRRHLPGSLRLPRRQRGLEQLVAIPEVPVGASLGDAEAGRQRLDRDRSDPSLRAQRARLGVVQRVQRPAPLDPLS